MRLAIAASHPIQYYAPLFRELARRIDVNVLYAHQASSSDQAAAEFGVEFNWDVDLLHGYQNEFLENRSPRPGLQWFGGCDTPGVASALRRFAPHAVLSLGWFLKSFVQAIVAAKALQIPVSCRGDSNLRSRRGLLKRLAKQVAYPPFLRSFDAGLYVGKRSKDYWLHYGYPADRLFFSPHSVDNDWFRAHSTKTQGTQFRERHGLEQNRKVVTFVGKLVERKRPMDLVEALGQLGRPDVTLLLVGAGCLEDNLVRRAEQLRVQCVAVGFQNQSELPAVYASSDLLVLPSDESETWGLVANEALACGVPIVVSDACGCAPDLGFPGLVTQVGQISDLTRAITQALDTPPTPIELQEKIESYSIAAAADGVVHAVERLAKTR